MFLVRVLIVEINNKYYGDDNMDIGEVREKLNLYLSKINDLWRLL